MSTVEPSPTGMGLELLAPGPPPTGGRWYAVPCPYAERRGALIYCKVAGKPVNPLSYPCLSKTKYKKCKYYKKAAETMRKTETRAPETPATRSETPKPVPPTPPVPVRLEPVRVPLKPSTERREPGPSPIRVPPPDVEVKVAAPSSSQQGVAAPRMPKRTKGLTLDGRPARNCLECIYYGSHTKTCLLLGVEVRDPYDPPCAES